jgi:hypothetical protein
MMPGHLKCISYKPWMTLECDDARSFKVYFIQALDKGTMHTDHLDTSFQGKIFRSTGQLPRRLKALWSVVRLLRSHN